MKLVETIRIEDGRVMHIDYHNDRCNKSRVALFNSKRNINLRSYIKPNEEHQVGIFKCRVIYGKKVESVEITPSPKRVIDSFKLINEVNIIKYGHKLLERKALDELYDKRGNADEIIILQNELVTDAYYFNLVFESKEEMITPRFPLLKGTTRAYLLDHHMIEVGDIHMSEILSFEKVHFINALNPLGNLFVEL